MFYFLSNAFIMKQIVLCVTSRAILNVFCFELFDVSRLQTQGLSVVLCPKISFIFTSMFFSGLLGVLSGLGVMKSGQVAMKGAWRSIRVFVKIISAMTTLFCFQSLMSGYQ